MVTTLRVIEPSWTDDLKVGDSYYDATTDTLYVCTEASTGKWVPMAPPLNIETPPYVEDEIMNPYAECNRDE